MIIQFYSIYVTRYVMILDRAGFNVGILVKQCDIRIETLTFTVL